MTGYLYNIVLVLQLNVDGSHWQSGGVQVRECRVERDEGKENSED